MKRHSLELLFRHRDHLLEMEQVALQEKLAEENEQKVRLENLVVRIRRTHEAKLGARTVEGVRVLDEAAAYLQGRFIMAKRALGLAGLAREEAAGRTLKAKISRDQIGLLLENGRRAELHEMEVRERQQLDDLSSARYVMAMTGAGA
jgi:hypothetical protein